MTKQGIIVAIENGIAKIRVERASACGGNCVSCKGCPSETVFIQQSVDSSFVVGDRVRIEKKTGFVLLEAFLGYGIPSVFFVLGAVLGYQFWKTERASVLLAFGALFIAIVLVKTFSKFVQQEFIIRKLDETS